MPAQISNLFAVLNSDDFTEFLGVMALGAFVLIVIWVFSTVLKDASKKQAVFTQREAEAMAAPETALGAKPDEPNAFDEEVKRFNEEYTEYYDEIIEVARKKMGELVVNARSSLKKITKCYSLFARNQNGDCFDVLRARFEAVCDAQWEYMKSELGYVGFKDLDAAIHMVLNSRELYNPDQAGDDVEMSPASSRAQEVIMLQETLPHEKVGSFHIDTINSVEPYKKYYEKYVKEWMHETQFNIVQRIRKKGAEGVSIKDTDLKERFVRLKNTLEIFSNVSERLESNLHEIGEEEPAYYQVILACVILSIIGKAPEWFPELGDSEVDHFERAETVES